MGDTIRTIVLCKSRDDRPLNLATAVGYNSTMAETFRDALKRRMAETGLSLRQVSARSGVSYSQLLKLNARDTASTNVEDARAIAQKVFGVSLDQMFSDEDVRDHIEIVEIYYQLPRDARQWLLKSAEGMRAATDLSEQQRDSKE